VIMNGSLKERFRQVDRIPTPWDDAVRGPTPLAEPRHRGRIAAVAVAASLAVTAALAIVVIDRDAGPRHGPLTGDVSWLTRTAGSCVERYSPQTLQGRSWAFEGVITAVDEAVGPDATDPGGSTTAVTFDVVRWFWGGSEEVASLRTYTSPSSAGEVERSLGVRLLLAGEEDFLWQCGFTKPFTEERLREFEAAALARAG
jgi:hypothetical protein